MALAKKQGRQAHAKKMPSFPTGHFFKRSARLFSNPCAPPSWSRVAASKFGLPTRFPRRLRAFIPPAHIRLGGSQKRLRSLRNSPLSRSLRSSPLLPDGQIMPFTSCLGVKAASTLYAPYGRAISLSPRPALVIISPASRSDHHPRLRRPVPGAPQNGKRREAGSFVASFAPYAAIHLQRRIMPLFATRRSDGTSSALCVERRHSV